MDRIADPWGRRTPTAAGAPWPERVDEHLAPGAAPDRLTRPLLRRGGALEPVWVELSAADAGRLGLAEGDIAEVRSARGSLRGPVRITGVREGVVFIPFHYGWWDRPDGSPRAANALTRTAWDPVSKQPLFKSGAVAVVKVG